MPTLPRTLPCRRSSWLAVWRRLGIRGAGYLMLGIGYRILDAGLSDPGSPVEHPASSIEHRVSSIENPVQASAPESFGDSGALACTSFQPSVVGPDDGAKRGLHRAKLLLSVWFRGQSG